MTVFWVSFRLSEETTTAGTYTKRYNALVDKMKSYVSPPLHYWHHTTSFFVLSSDQNLRTIASGLKSVLTADKDHFLIRCMEYKEAMTFGKNPDADIYKLMVGEDGKTYLTELK